MGVMQYSVFIDFVSKYRINNNNIISFSDFLCFWHPSAALRSTFFHLHDHVFSKLFCYKQYESWELCFFPLSFFYKFIISSFELPYWNIKLGEQVRSGTGKVASDGTHVPNRPLPVQLQCCSPPLNSVRVLMRWTSKGRESGPTSSTREMKSTGEWRCFSHHPCSKTQGEQPCRASPATSGIWGPKAASA